MELVGRLVVGVLEAGDLVLEGQQDAGVDLEREVQVERAVARLLRVEVDLPGLAQGVGLDEVALVVHVEAVVDGVLLEVGDEAGDVDDGHVSCAPRVGGEGRHSLPLPCPPMEPAGAARRAPRRARRRRRRRPRRRRATGGWPAPGPASTAATWPPTPPASPCWPAPGSACCPRRAALPDAEPPTSLVVLDPLDGSTNAAAASRGTPRRCARSTPTGPLAAVVVEPRDAACASRRCAAAGRARDGAPLGAVGRDRAAPSRSSACRATRPAALRLEPVPRARRRRPRPVRGGRRRARRLRRLQPRRPRLVGLPRRRCSSARRPAPSWPTPSAASSCVLDHAARRTPVAAATPALLAELRRRPAGASRDRAHVHRAAAAGLPPAAGPGSACAAVHAISAELHVGAICVIERADGARAARAPHLPPAVGHARRAASSGARTPRTPRGARRCEEVGLRVELVGEPAVVVEPGDAAASTSIFAARPAAGADPRRRAPRSPEIVECRWFAADDLPPLQHETGGALVTLARREAAGRAGGPARPAPPPGRSTAGPRSGGAASRAPAPRSGGSARG